MARTAHRQKRSDAARRMSHPDDALESENGGIIGDTGMRARIDVEQVMDIREQGKASGAERLPAAEHIDHRITGFVDAPGGLLPSDLDIALELFDIIVLAMMGEADFGVQLR